MRWYWKLAPLFLVQWIAWKYCERSKAYAGSFDYVWAIPFEGVIFQRSARSSRAALAAADEGNKQK